MGAHQDALAYLEAWMALEVVVLAVRVDHELVALGAGLEMTVEGQEEVLV